MFISCDDCFQLHVALKEYEIYVRIVELIIDALTLMLQSFFNIFDVHLLFIVACQDKNVVIQKQLSKLHLISLKSTH